MAGWRGGLARARIVQRMIKSLDAASVIGVFCVLMVLPSGVTRLSGPDTIAPAGLRGTVSVLEIRGPSDQRPHPVRVWRPPGPDAATIPVLYFLHGYPGAASDPFTAGLARTLNGLLRQGYPPFVVASVDGNGERHQAYAMDALRYSFTFLSDNWRQAAANDTGF